MSMRLEGVLQPIAVRYERGRRSLHHHPWRATLACRRIAGLESIPAIVRDVPEERRLIQQLMENVVREDLNAIDRAAALRALKRQMNDAPWEQVAEAVGIRRSRLFQLLGTEKLPESVQQDLRAGRLSEKQSARAAGSAGNRQQVLAHLILDDGLPQVIGAASRSRRSRRSVVYVDLDEQEVDRRFTAMREAIDASAQRSKQRPRAPDLSAAFANAAGRDAKRIDSSLRSLDGTSLARDRRSDRRDGAACCGPIRQLNLGNDERRLSTNGCARCNK